MTPQHLGYFRVNRITADAIGKPGSRVFYLQMDYELDQATFIIEKPQLNTLAVGIERLVTGIVQRFPTLSAVDGEYDPEQMRIQPPVDPLFRVGEISLTFDYEEDLVGLHLTELAFEQIYDDAHLRAIAFLCTRDQIMAFARWSLSVISQGRQICPQCGEPMDPQGHFCPKKNGHKKATG